MKKLLFLLLPLLSFSNDWGKTGHRIVGEIAERQLTNEVKEIVYNILDGESLSSVSTWPDEMKSNPDFKDYNKWHYVNLPLDKEYPDVEHTQDNIVMLIERATAILKSPTADKEIKKFYLKYLVHLVGDLHQPMHTGQYEDYGGSKIKLKFKGKNTNLHVLWDSNLIEDFKMSYTEWANHLENKNRKNTIKQKNVLDWTFESHWWAKDIYKNTKEEDYLSYNYIYKYQPILEQRLYQAGKRLGNLLNEIFS